MCSPEFKQVLVPTDHSNILTVSKSFKLYQKFHTKIENLESSLTDAILGVTQNPKVIVSNSETAQQPYTFQDEVIEKPEVCSTIAAQYKSLQVTSLADVFFDQPQEQSQTFATKNQNLYRVHFQTVCVQPNNLFELCQLYCSQCRQTSSFRTLSQTADTENQGVCQQCKTT